VELGIIFSVGRLEEAPRQIDERLPAPAEKLASFPNLFA
jgi:hypothetical protein